MYGNMTITAYFTYVTDTTPPVPNPMTWAIAPMAISDTQITMTATTATDAESPPVEYYFTNLNDASHNSGWQDSTTYTDSGLSSNTTYTYNVRARDSVAPVPNVTAASADANATTNADTTCPDPNPPWFVSAPAAVSDTAITMTAATETDAQGPVQYYFANKTVSGHDSGWQLLPTYTDTSLTPNARYYYTVKARDNALVRNYTAESNQMYAFTLNDVTPPDPNPATFVIAPHGTGTTTIAMQATIATDASNPVYYQFYRATIGNTSLSAWQTDSNFIDTGLTENTTNTYQVRTKDSAVPTANIGAWSAAASATTSKTLMRQINDVIFAFDRSTTTPTYQPMTISILAGTYNEDVEINEPNITLQSASGSAVTIIQLVSADTNGINIKATGCTIGGSSGHGFAIKSSRPSPTP